MELKRYMINPSMQMLAVYEVTGNQEEEIANENIEEENGTSLKVIQTIKGYELITKTEMVYTSNGVNVTQKEELVMIVPENQKLVYVKNKGFVIPERNICTIEEAIENLSVLKED